MAEKDDRSTNSDLPLQTMFHHGRQIHRKACLHFPAPHLVVRDGDQLEVGLLGPAADDLGQCVRQPHLFSIISINFIVFSVEKRRNGRTGRRRKHETSFFNKSLEAKSRGGGERIGLFIGVACTHLSHTHRARTRNI